MRVNVSFKSSRKIDVGLYTTWSAMASVAITASLIVIHAIIKSRGGL